MFGRSTRRSSIRSRLAAGLGSALLLASMSGTFVPIAAAGPLTITNTDSPDPVQSGSQILYTIVVTNTGGAKVSNVVLTDQINGVAGFGNPPLLDVVSTRGSCTQTNTQITCNAGTIEGNGAWTVTVRGVVTAAGGTTINNIATVVATKSAQTYTSSASATTQVQGSGPGGPSPDLTIGKNGPLQVTPGQGITYTLTVNNLGNGNALGVKVIDTFPAGISPVTVNATSLFSCGISGQTVTCINGRVNAGSNATITINGTIAAAAAGDLENTSVVDPDNTIDEGIIGNTADAAELNNFSNTVVTHVSPVPPPPTNVIFFDKQGPATAIPGQLVRYTLTMTNGTVGRADYITLTDGTQGLQAASLRVVSAASSSGTNPICTVAAPTVECTMTRLATNGTLVVVIEGMVVASAGSTIINSAAVNANVKNKGYTERDEVQTIVNAGRDLTISKSDLPDPVCARSWPAGVNTLCRGGLSYTFDVGNSGVQDALNVLVRDPLPPGTTYDDAASSSLCNESGGIVSCLIPNLGAGATETITIVLVAPATLGTITNTVTVDPFNSVFEADETNNIAVESTTIVTGIDLTIAKAASLDPIATSGTEVYTITVDNIGTQNATGIKVVDTLPAGATFLSATADNGFTCSYSAPNVTCLGGSLLGTASELYFPPAPGNDTAVITIRIFARPTIGVMHNEVRVDPDGTIDEFDETNNIATLDVNVVNGGSGEGAFNELAIDKTGPASVSTSGIVTYTIKVTNDGSDPAVNVTMRDTLPAGFVYIDAFDTVLGPNAFLCTPGAGNTVDCTGATITPGAVGRTVTLRAFASPALGTYTNQAIVDPGNLIPEGNETNNADNAQTNVVVAPPTSFIDLTIEKTADQPTVTPDGTLIYELEVTNLGTNPAFGVVVRDTLPAGVTFVSARDNTGGLPPAPLAPGSFSCTHASGVVTCTGGTLDAGAAGAVDWITGIGSVRTINVTVRAPLASGIQILNVAQVDPDNTIGEGNEINNTSDVQVAVVSDINLTIEKTGPTTATQSQTATYDITVSNADSAFAGGVVVVDPLPVGMIPLTAFTDDPGENNFACQVEQNPVNRVTCTGDLPGNTSVVIHIEVFITATDGTTLDNEACVDPENTIVETNELDNCSTALTQIGVPDLAINKAASLGVVTEGESLSYFLSVSNQGDAATPGAVDISDDLPPGVTFVSATGTNEFVCTEAATVVSCTDGAGAAPGLEPGESTLITIQVTVATSSGPIINTGNVTNVAGEIELDNNSDSATVSVGTTAADLVLTNLGDQPDPVAEGDVVTYRYAVTNTGTEEITGIEITQTFDSLTSVSLVSITASQGFGCSGPAGLVFTCIGDLDPGATTTVTLVLQTTAGAPASISSTIEVDPDGTITESDETNNTATEETTISAALCTGCIDLAVTGILESADPITVGDTVTYTMTVGNIGDTSTDTTGGDDVTIFFDVFGDFTGLTYSTTSGFTCSPFLATPGVSTFSNCTGDLDPGEGAILTITVTANDDVPDLSASAQAFVGPPGVDVDASNNGPIAASTVVNP